MASGQPTFCKRPSRCEQQTRQQKSGSLQAVSRLLESCEPEGWGHVEADRTTLDLTISERGSIIKSPPPCARAAGGEPPNDGEPTGGRGTTGPSARPVSSAGVR